MTKGIGFVDRDFLGTFQCSDSVRTLFGGYASSTQSVELDMKQFDVEDSDDLDKLYRYLVEPRAFAVPEVRQRFVAIQEISRSEEACERAKRHLRTRTSIKEYKRIVKLAVPDQLVQLWQIDKEWIGRQLDATVSRNAKRFVEYGSASGSPTSTKASAFTDGRKLHAFSSAMKKWFEDRGWSDTCRVHAVEIGGGEVLFSVTHGNTIQRHEGVDGSHLVQPKETDTLRFDAADGILAIATQYSSEREQYRATFGQVFFKNRDQFDLEGRLYQLEHLADASFRLATPEPITSAKLKEVKILYPAVSDAKQTTNGKSLLDEERVLLNFDLDHEIVEASFHIAIRGERGVRKVVVRPPLVAEFDRERHAEPILQFLRANRIRVLRGSRALAL